MGRGDAGEKKEEEMKDHMGLKDGGVSPVSDFLVGRDSFLEV